MAQSQPNFDLWRLVEYQNKNGGKHRVLMTGANRPATLQQFQEFAAKFPETIEGVNWVDPKKEGLTRVRSKTESKSDHKADRLDRIISLVEDLIGFYHKARKDYNSGQMPESVQQFAGVVLKALLGGVEVSNLAELQKTTSNQELTLQTYGKAILELTEESNTHAERLQQIEEGRRDDGVSQQIGAIRQQLDELAGRVNQIRDGEQLLADQVVTQMMDRISQTVDRILKDNRDQINDIHNRHAADRKADREALFEFFERMRKEEQSRSQNSRYDSSRRPTSQKRHQDSESETPEPEVEDVHTGEWVKAPPKKVGLFTRVSNRLKSWGYPLYKFDWALVALGAVIAYLVAYYGAEIEREYSVALAGLVALIALVMLLNMSPSRWVTLAVPFKGGS